MQGQLRGDHGRVYRGRKLEGDIGSGKSRLTEALQAYEDPAVLLSVQTCVCAHARVTRVWRL